MTEQHQMGIFPQWTKSHKQALPVFGGQRLPERVGALQKCSVFIEHRQRIARRAAYRLDTGLCDLRHVQLVQAALGLGKQQPRQPVEKVMQPVARGNLTGAVDKSLVGFAGG